MRIQPRLLHPLAAALLVSLNLATHAQQTTAPGASEQPAKGQGAAGSGTSDAQALAAVDAQIAAMRNIHEKLRLAKTPQERQALRVEHWKVMQDARAMMRRNEMGWGAGLGMQGGMMGPGGAGMMGPGTGAMGGPGARRPPAAQGAPSQDPAEREAWNERRLDMMQAVMEMMMEYLPAAPR